MRGTDYGRIVLGNNMLRQTRAQTEQTLKVTLRNGDFHWKHTVTGSLIESGTKRQPAAEQVYTSGSQPEAMCAPADI